MVLPRHDIAFGGIIVINLSMFTACYSFPENVGRLKKLEYLNLALNNVEVIENLEGNSSYYS